MQIKQKVNGLVGLIGRLQEIKVYLEKVISGAIPINNQITYNLQNIFNLLPNLNIDELVKAMLVKTNDMHLVVYISSLIRSVLALHGLLTNKIKYKDIDDLLDREVGIKDNEKNVVTNNDSVKMSEEKSPDSKKNKKFEE